MKKETYYFSHDFGARNDPKIQRLIVEIGAAGLGAYWCLVEQLYEQGGILPMYVCKSTAFALHLEPGLITSIIKDFDLFEHDDANFWSKSVNERLGERKRITESRKKAAETRWKSRGDTQKQSTCNPPTLQNAANKVKKIKEKETSTEVDAEIDNEEENIIKEEVATPTKKRTPSQFKPPSLDEVKGYIAERNSPIDPEAFWNFYQSKGWMVGKNKMKDWKACVRTWENNDRQNGRTQVTQSNGVSRAGYGRRDHKGQEHH